MSEQHTNVLLVCVDQWSGLLLGSAGHPTILTPTLDQVAESGIRFSNAYSSTPICIPARRTLMTGTTSRTHGERCFNETGEMPDPAQIPTLAQTFANAGYQCYAVGKLHVYPQRDRIGFHEVISYEEGRHHLGGGSDDWEMALSDAGHPGAEFAGGMINNDYIARPWHLDESLHPTNWLTREMCRTIVRRDPKRPAFWYLGYNFPHPPMIPLQCYIDMYPESEIDAPHFGDWSEDVNKLPISMRTRAATFEHHSARSNRLGRQAFYALCTHIDHQLRLVLGTLREEGLLDNTAVIFTSDHGDHLGNHNIYGKATFFEDSAHIPMILMPPAAQYDRTGHRQVDDRLVELRDVMPTLLDMAGVDAPDTVEGMSMIGDTRRDDLYGELWEDAKATRMIHDGRYKLVWYGYGNHLYLFDLENDPREQRNLADDPAHKETRDRLTARLIEHLYGVDEQWVKDGQLVGTDEPEFIAPHNRRLHGQRGWRFMSHNGKGNVAP